MNSQQAKEILDRVVGSVFGYQNPLSLEQAMQKFAFDLRLPQQVYDAKTNEPTWASSLNPSAFVTVETARKLSAETDNMQPKTALNSVEDIVTAWSRVNYTTAERYIDSINVSESDLIYNSENIYRSVDLRNSKNVIFTESGNDLEYVVAGSRSTTSTYCIRVEDSQLCSNSFNVIWSSKVTNSLFVQDCYDIMDCMFCSNIAGKRFCIANMQFSEDEYNEIKKKVIYWALTS